MYTDIEKLSHFARSQAYAKAMEQVAQRYPQDDEAQIHYGITLNTSASPADKTYASQLKGAAILEPIFERQPQHPGVAHYLIHLYDYPPIAEKGLKAARLYAKIAPGAAHAQHMPSHIFTRVGYWQESIDSKQSSRRASRRKPRSLHDQLHAMDYMVYAYLQLGQDTKARPSRRNADDQGLHRDIPGGTVCAGRLTRALRVRARRLEDGRRTHRPAEPLANIEAMTHFARALGAARTGNPEAAKAGIAKLGRAARQAEHRRTAIGRSRSISR